MDSNQLLTSTVELGLSLLEKNVTFLPFCKAVNCAGDTFIYTPVPAVTEAQESESVRSNVMRDLKLRALVGVAFCHDVQIRFNEPIETMPAIKVELHYRGNSAAVWYFAYKMEGEIAKVQSYYTNPCEVSVFTHADSSE